MVKFYQGNDEQQQGIYSSTDFTGLEFMTDFMVYCIVKCIKENELRVSVKKNQTNRSELKIAGCKNLTVWSLHYLIQIKDNEKSMLSVGPVSVKERVAGCDSISEEMAVSLEPASSRFRSKRKNDSGFYTYLRYKTILIFLN
jgi:hypothetical protein